MNELDISRVVDTARLRPFHFWLTFWCLLAMLPMRTCNGASPRADRSAETRSAASLTSATLREEDYGRTILLRSTGTLTPRSAIES